MAPALLLAVLTAAPGAAAPLPDCLGVTKSSATMAAPRTFQDLRACQRAAADSVPAAQRDALDEHQRAEARAFFADPDHVVTGPDDGADAGAKDAGGAADAPAASADLPPGVLPGSAAASVMPRVSPADAAALAAVKAGLDDASAKGKAGDASGMADGLRAALLRTQGGVSPQMQALLDSVSKSGGQVTPDVLRQLQQAGGAAEGRTRSLQADPEKALKDGLDPAR